MPYVILFFIILALIIGYFALLGWIIVLIASFALTPLLLLALGASFTLAAVMPIVLLTGSRWREGRDRNLRTPGDVRRGDVLGKAPRGETSGYGWDPAWPTYFPYQAQRDFVFVSRWMWNRARAFFALPIRWAGALWHRNDGMVRWGWWLPVIVGLLVTVGIPSWTFAVLVTVFTSIFVAVLWLVIAAATVVSRSGGFIYGAVERNHRRRESKKLTCPNPDCYRTTYSPGYQCPTCSQVHRLLHPGPLGVLRRICECGTGLPSTVSRASKRKLTVVCPYCDSRLDATAGARPTVLVPVFGPVAAGKTTLFASAVRGMAMLTAAKSGSVSPKNPPARRFMELAESGGMLPKTVDASRPDVMVFEVSLEGREYEVQLVDAAGERFATQESTVSLTYIDASDAWVFVLDPLMLPEVRSRLEEHAVDLGPTGVGAGDLASSYQSVVERIKATTGDLRGRALAMVVTKADLLVKVPEWSDLGSGESVKNLLIQAGAHNLVKSAEFDFGKELEFFATEANTRELLDPRRDPVRIVDWAVARRRMKLRFLDPESAASTENSAATSPKTGVPAQPSAPSSPVPVQGD